MCSHEHSARIEFFKNTVTGYAAESDWKNTSNEDFDQKFIGFGSPIPKKIGHGLFCSCSLINFVDANEAELKMLAGALGAKTDYKSLVSLTCYLKQQQIEAKNLRKAA